MFGKPPARPSQAIPPQPLKTFYRLVKCPICEEVVHVTWDDEREFVTCTKEHNFAANLNPASLTEVVGGAT
jgi:hypothetical protein